MNTASVSEAPRKTAIAESAAMDSRPSHVLRGRETHSAVDAIFRPRSVAIIGATDRLGSVGRALMENLASFPGPVYPINLKRSSILERRVFPNIGVAPASVDLAVIATPAETMPAVVQECAAAGVRTAVILSAGFKEIGATGTALEQQVLTEARLGNMRLVGPNCLGVISPHGKLNASFAADAPLPGNVAFISQSGALCTAILDWSLREGVGFSAFVSVGSMLDIGWAELIDWLGDDPHTDSIVIYMESVGDARAFLSAAREVALRKPIIVLKAGRTEAAARAAASHTGALAGSDVVLDVALRRAGALRVGTLGELFNMAEILAKQPRSSGPRLAILTNAGGPGALAVDGLVTSGGEPAPLEASTLRKLDGSLPRFWSHGNPVDILGDADGTRYLRAAGAVIEDPSVDGTLVILTPQAMTDASATAKALASLPRHGKPLLASWMGGARVDEGRRILAQAGIPSYEYPDTAARAFSLMWQHSKNLQALYETPLLPKERFSSDRKNLTANVLQTALQTGRNLLSKAECNTILAAYDIPVLPTHVATSEEQAVDAARHIGYPVVLKLHSATVTHKSDVGGVKLRLPDDEAVHRAWNEIKNSVTPGDFLGVTVEPMISADTGYELILGSSVDPQFGPVLLFGAGGLLVEVIKDTALALPPLTTTLARQLMENTRIIHALKGVRGRAPISLEALDQLLVQFSQLVVEHPRIAEIDVNPLLVLPDKCVALDARIILHPSHIQDGELPRPAIRPYPAQYADLWRPHSGTAIHIRPIRPEDEPLMVAFHQRLSEDTVYQRYFSTLKLDHRIAHARLSRLCFIDYDREMALVAEVSEAGGAQTIIGVGRLIKMHGSGEAEFALLVSDAWQGQGLGTELLRRLIVVARDKQISRITASILPTNHAMQSICRELGFAIHLDWEARECKAALDLIQANSIQ